MQVLVSNYGSFLGKKSERLVVKENNKVVMEVPFHDLEQITIETSGASLSTDLIKECMEHGIQINFLSSQGKPYAKLSSPNLTGTVITRREQILAYLDRRGIQISKTFVEGKIKNQISTLKYFAKYRKTQDMELFNQIYQGISQMENNLNELKDIQGTCIDDVRGQLLSVEGRAANVYWQMIKILTSDKIDFPGREHRGAADPVNSLLNYGYGMLQTQIWGAIILAGLEPFAGFLHVDRPGKPSLVLDMMEEFRQPVVDRVVIAMVNKGTEIRMDGDKLDTTTRRDFAARILERLDSEERFEGKKFKVRTIIQRQARRIATFLRGESKHKPFVAGW